MSKNKSAEKLTPVKKPVLNPEEVLADACYTHCVKVDMTPAEALILIRCVRYGASAVSKAEHENGAAEAIRNICDNFIDMLLDSLTNVVAGNKQASGE
mgnify:CR=1 FL=1